MKIIAAVSLDGAIGNDEKLLWHVSEDLKHYKELTYGNICIVGLNTYNGLPHKALKNRTTIVISGDYGDKMIDIDAFEDEQPRHFISSDKVPGSKIYNRSTVDEAIDTANKIKTNDQRIFVIGGSMVYKSMIDLCDEAEITWINKTYPGANKRFPIDKLFNDFSLTHDSGWLTSTSNISYKFTSYERFKTV